MKNIFLSLLLLSGITLGVSAQEKREVREGDVPEAVKTALKNAYPNAGDVDWKMKDSMYKAKFKMDGTNYITGIDPSGEIKSRGIEIQKIEIPAEVTTSIRLNHSGWTIDDAYRIQENGNVKYLIELDGNPDKKVLYSHNGKLEKEMPIDD